MNRTIKLLMLSDIFVVTGFGLMDPILAIFIKENLVGGTIFAAGLASMLFLITKSIIQLPFSKYVDKTDKKEKWLVVGTFLIAMVPILYIFAKDVSWIYMAQILHGIGSGLAFPTWLGLWSTNLDKKKESFEWSLYATFTGLGTALTATIGATIASVFGFMYTFILVGILSIFGCLILFWLQKNKRPKLEKIVIMNFQKYEKKSF